MLAELIGILLTYPYELIRVRFLTRNDVFHYYTITDAVTKIVHSEMAKGLYKGLPAYSCNYVVQYSLSIVIYELAMDFQKHSMSKEQFEKWNNFCVLRASFTSGILTALCTNSFEVFIVRK